MTREEIAEFAEALRKRQLAVVDPSMSNYRSVLKQYKDIINDALVLIRELAEWRPTPEPVSDDVFQLPGEIVP